MNAILNNSIRFKLTSAILGSVILITVISSVIIIKNHVQEIEDQLAYRMKNATNLSNIILSSALWQFNFDYVDNFVESLFLYEDVVFVRVYSKSDIIKTKNHPDFNETNFEHFLKKSEYLSKEIQIKHAGVRIGKIQIALTRDRVKQSITKDISIALLQIVLIVIAVVITNLLLTRLIIFKPFDKLKQATSRIAQGDFETTIDISAMDEVGHLAKSINQMMHDIKLITASKDELNHEIVERKKIEEELINNKILLDTTGRMAKVGGWELTLDKMELSWTEETHSIHEVPVDYIPELEDAIHFYHPGDRDLISNVVKNAIEDGKPYDVEVRFITAKGNHLWIRTQCSPQIENGKVTKLLGTFQDITEKKSVENTLRESENRFKMAGKVAYDLIYEWEVKSGKLIWYGDIDGLLGFDEGEISRDIGAWLNLIHQDDRPKLKEAVDIHRTSTQPIQYEYRVKNRAGTYLYWKDNGLPLIDENDGLPYKWIGVCSDITQRKETEKALRESEEKYRHLFENLYDVYYRSDDQGRVTLISPSAEKVFGYSPDELIGEQIKDFYVYPEEREKLLTMLAEEGYVENFVALLRRKDGSSVWISTNAKLIINDNGTVAGLEGIARDISSQKQMEERLRQTQKMESVGSLAGGIAHDFNNILSSILGFTELSLDDAPKDSMLNDNLQEVYSAGKRAKELVKQILAFARQSGEEISPISPSELVHEVLQFLRSTLPSSIEIQTKIQSNSFIMGNATQMHQVLMNLCTNAEHAMRESGGILEVSLADIELSKENLMIGMRPGEYIEIKISDTGTGIPQENIDSIFDPYFTTKELGEGTGMGLAVVQGIIESYGGKITVKSQIGKGSTFSIHLPVTQRISKENLYKSEPLPVGSERILLVDDEESIAKMGARTLENLGYSVVTRTSSIEALELFRAKPNKFDLVLTDMTMPNLTGDKMAIEMMKIREDIPVILCTGYSKKISDITASDIGIKAFAYKPIIKADLAKTLREVLDNTNVQHEA